ncbi:MAG TPA: lytic transglycosylase F [Gammaproteobacteria bacterium]|nr:lytic transglycosylase F [Gammaproteobacteria bacterium]
MTSRYTIQIHLILACLFTLLFPGPGLAVDDVKNIPGYTGIFRGDLPEIRKRKVLRALVTYNRTDFFFYQGGTRGIQVEFLNEYVKYLNKGVKREENRVHVTYIPVSFNELIPALRAGRGDIAADFLTITAAREKQVSFITGGDWKISELVVSNKAAGKLESIEALSGKPVYVLNGSSYIEHLEALNREFRKQKLAPVKIRPVDAHLLSEDILEMVNSGTLRITVVDDYIARLWKKVLPGIRVHDDLAISTGNRVGWAVRKQNPALLESLNNFSRKIKKGTLLGNMLFKRYYKDTRWIKNPTGKTELKKLSALTALFEKYGRKYGFDSWALIAQAYQESGLDNNRRSARGAVGIMQILPSTAADRNVNIKNVRQLENNIHAATKYLAFLRERYFSDPGITPENRLAFTWAAYNAGPARINKMRARAKKMGLDPNVWFLNVELAVSKFVGREPVRYVAHVYKYYVAYKLAAEATGKKTTILSMGNLQESSQ